MDDTEWTGSIKDERKKSMRFRVPVKVEEIIGKVIKRLPEDVRRFIDDNNCQFVSVESDNGMTIHSLDYPKPCWLIVLGSDIDERIVAHEIAHAFLRHRGPVTTVQPQREAWALTSKWGFDYGDSDKDKIESR